MSKYTPQQMAIIKSPAAMIAALATPGSGKTTTLIGRISRDFRDDITDPAKTAVITFTNDAANQLKEKLARACVPEPSYVGTLHGWCLRQIQSGNTTVLTEATADEIMQHVIDENRLRTTCEQVRKALLGKRADAQATLALRLYRKSLKEANAVDYDLILVAALEHLENNPTSTAHLYVDEFQDSSEIDLKIYDAIKPFTMVVVGDLDQSIYGFRGGRPENLKEFMQRPNTETLLLEDNWRSVPEICAAANNVIGHNRDRVSKEIKPTRPSAEKGSPPAITMQVFNGEGLESLKVCGAIREMIDGGEGPTDIAVLVRYNADRKDFIDALTQAGVPVANRAPARPRDWKRAEAALSALVTPENAMAVIGWRMSAGESWAIAQQRVNDLRRQAAPLMPEYMMRATGNDYAGRRDAILHALREDGISRATLEEIDGLRLKRVTDIIVAMREPKEAAEPGVTVSTYHSAKGLEWPVVFMPACEDRMCGKDAEEEDRRLFFVAITRAKDQLHLSAAKMRRTTWGAKLPQDTGGPLRFIDEMKIDSIIG